MITNPKEPYFKDGIWGWDGSVWRKLPMVWGYSELAGEDLKNTNLPAGLSVLEGTAVGTGEVMVVAQVEFFYLGTAPDRIDCRAYGTPGTPILLARASPVPGDYYYTHCFQILAEGHTMRATVKGATAGDAFYFRYSGYKMKIAE